MRALALPPARKTLLFLFQEPGRGVGGVWVGEAVSSSETAVRGPGRGCLGLHLCQLPGAALQEQTTCAQDPFGAPTRGQGPGRMPPACSGPQTPLLPSLSLITHCHPLTRPWPPESSFSVTPACSGATELPAEAWVSPANPTPQPSSRRVQSAVPHTRVLHTHSLPLLCLSWKGKV